MKPVEILLDKHPLKRASLLSHTVTLSKTGQPFRATELIVLQLKAAQGIRVTLELSKEGPISIIHTIDWP